MSQHWIMELHVVYVIDTYTNLGNGLWKCDTCNTYFMLPWMLFITFCMCVDVYKWQVCTQLKKLIPIIFTYVQQINYLISFRFFVFFCHVIFLFFFFFWFLAPKVSLVLWSTVLKTFDIDLVQRHTFNNQLVFQ